MQSRQHWFVSVASTFFFGVGQMMIVMCAQNYCIDAFERYAASAVAAGAVLRSVCGGLVPLFTPSLFKSLGYDWGMSVFALVSLVLAPAPVLIYRYGEHVRRRFPVNL